MLAAAQGGQPLGGGLPAVAGCSVLYCMSGVRSAGHGAESKRWSSGGMNFRLLAAAQRGSLSDEYWVYLRAAVQWRRRCILATGTGQMALDTVLGITLSITQVQHLP